MCELPLEVWIDGARQASHTRFVRPCAWAATLDTRILAPAFRVHLSSDYTGDPERKGTRSRHLADARGPAGGRSDWAVVEHAAGEIDVRDEPRGCLYDHLCRVLELIGSVEGAGRIEVHEPTLRLFDALARRSALTDRARHALPPAVNAAARLSAWGLGASG